MLASVGLAEMPPHLRIDSLGSLHQLNGERLAPVWQLGAGASQERQGSQAWVRMRARGESSFAAAQWRISRPPQAEYALTQVEMRTHQLAGATIHWPLTGVLVHNLYSAGVKLWFWPHQAIGLEPNSGSTSGWVPVVGLMPLSKQTKTIVAIPYVLAKQGYADFRNLRITAGTESTFYSVAFHALATTWILFALASAATLLRGSECRCRRAVTIIVGIALIAASIAPQPNLRDFLQASSFEAQDIVADAGDAISELLQDVRHAARQASELGSQGGREMPTASELDDGDDAAQTVEAKDLEATYQADGASEPIDENVTLVVPRSPAQAEPARRYWQPQFNYTDKLAHLSAFASLTCLAFWAWRRPPVWRIVVGVAATSTCVQIIQYLEVTREPDVNDAIADFTGICIATMLMLGITRWRRTRA